MNGQPAHCPFLNKTCIRDKCALYGKVQVATPGAVAGMVRVATIRGCAINLALLLLSQFNPQGTPDPTAESVLSRLGTTRD